MSDQNSFGTVATAPPPSVQAEEAPARSSKALLIAVGIALAVLAVFGYLLFFRGGGEPEATGVVVVPKPAPVVPGDTTDPAAATDTKTPPAKDVKSRNPFKPLVTEPAAADNTGTTPGTTTDPTTDPGTAPVGGTPPVTTPPVTNNPTGATVTVKLVSINSKNATVATKVGNVNYVGLSAGDTFGTNFQLYAIFNPQCAGFLYGDATFALCVGKSVTLDKK